MKYLSFDLEYATSRNGSSKICEFGYVITNEKFEVLERSNFIINPRIERNEWDWKVVNEILTRPIIEYECGFDFVHYYPKIKKLIDDADYIIGHTLFCDAKALNDDCLRFDLPSLNFEFYDVNLIYMEFSNKQQNTSVVNILNDLDIVGEDNIHNAETDAYNTMLELKKMLEILELSFEEIIELCPNVKDKNENYVVKSNEEKELLREKVFMENLSGDGTNFIRDHSINKKRYMQFIDNVIPNAKGRNKYKNKKIAISSNYEKEHYRQILNLVQLIVNEGGQVTLKASSANIFIKYDEYLEDGSINDDQRLNCVINENKRGSFIKIVEFKDFLSSLNITEDELDEMPLVSFDFLLEYGAIIKDKKDIEVIKNKNNKNNKNIKNGVVYSTKTSSSGSTLGDLLGSAFLELLKENAEQE